ncbi:DEKNAAC104156 [Brettanomyces naardenensis]|uniref:DEKNAAC104156 n=1 Tax=Brettanomyces naardenensis TaxID=13370 RepID=A0A448YQF3_BRENA|nr:DEKNAAC104156 [Brettanomyces naardenensis]
MAPVHYYRFFGKYFTSSDMVLVLAAFLFPPLEVYLQKGFSKELLISFILTAMAHVPGLIYSLYLIYDSGSESAGYLSVATDVEAGYDDSTAPLSPKPAGEVLGSSEGNVGSSTMPPTYEEATGDFKVQTGR